MKTVALQPADVLFDAPAHAGTPYAPAFGDVYHARAGALEQAQHVFLAGNGLPQRWQGRQRFVVLETGFGLGNNFLATWAAWSADPARCAQLVFISLEKHPLRPADMARAHAQSALPELAAQLLAQWPPLTPDLHSLSFEAGRVRLMLAFGDAHTWLPELVAPVDAFYLDGFSPSCNAPMWDERLIKACARLAAPGASAATWSVARSVRDALSAAGFAVSRTPGFGGKRNMLRAHWRLAEQRHPAPPGRQAQAQTPGTQTSALLIGAGLAGAAAARALAAQGLRVTVLERHAAPAQETSGNPAGIFHAVVHANDGAHAQLLRSGALHTAQLLRGPLARAELPGALAGLLRGTAAESPSAPPATHLSTETASDAGTTNPATPASQALAQMQQLLAHHALPADFAQALTQASAQARAGCALAGPAWFYPGGGWVSPPALVRLWLNTPGVSLQTGAEVARIQPREGGGWLALDASGQTLASADVLVLANAHNLAPLLAEHTDAASWPLSRSRGQVSWWPQAGAQAAQLPRPALPLASGSYLIGLPPELGGGVLCGATQQPEDADPTVREADHRYNLARLAELTGQPLDAAAALAAQPQGKVGWRLMCDDRLPLLGPVPQPWAALAGVKRLEQPRQVPRIAGLYVLSALGSRGLTLAPLLGEALAAWVCGAPQPLPASLLDAVDVARFTARRVRQQARAGAGPAAPAQPKT